MKKTKQTMLTAALLSAALAMQGELNYLSDSASAVTKSPEPADSGMRLMQGVYGPPPARTTTEAEETEESVTTITEAETTISDTTTSVTPMQSPEPMYGPPNIKGDIDDDWKLTIADYVLMKDMVASGKRDTYVDWAADLNHDDKIDKADLQMFEHFFFGLTSYPEETARVPEKTPVTSESESVTSESQVTQPAPVTTKAAMTTTIVEPTSMGTVYGPPPAYYFDQK